METMLYVACTSLPIHIIVFYQYWDYGWRSKKVAALLAFLNLFFKMIAVSWAITAGISIRLVEFVFSIFGIAIYFFSIRTNVFALLYTYIMALDYLMAIRGVASFIGVRLFSAGTQSVECSVICFALYAISLPFTLPFFRRASNLIYQTNAPDLWRVIWLAPALTSLIVLIYTNAFDSSSIGNFSALLARFCLLACILVVYYSLLQSLSEFQRRAIFEEQARQNENILALQRTQYANLQTYMEDIRRARHDLRQHQNIIKTFLESGEVDRLREYLNSQPSSHTPDTLHTYCENHGVNMLLNYYARQYIERNIDFEFQVSLPEQTAVAESDLCVLLGNLLENALEACSGQPEPYIRASSRLTGSHAVTIIVDNTAPLPPQQQDGLFRSSKHSGTGIGTQSIRYIAGQYSGTADFKWQDGMFFASVFLNAGNISAPETD